MTFPKNELYEEMVQDAAHSFTMKIGGTTYEVSIHFNPNGTQTVLEQFESLLKRQKFAPQI